MRPINKKTTIVLSLFAIAALTTTAAMARPHFDGGDASKFERIMKHVVNDAMDDIDATDAQRASVQATMTRTLKELAPLKGERQRTMEELRVLFLEDTIDADAVDARIAAKTKSMEETMRVVADAVVDVHAVLTPDQRKALMDNLEQHRGSRRGSH